MSQKYLFFSIVIPAHNEEQYITDTLQNIQDLEYPNQFLETFIIENGSNDNTYEQAKKFEKDNITVISSPIKGVSLARNIGIKKISPKSDWTIFLDADTIMKKNFINNFNNFLIKNEIKNYSTGTTEIQPLLNTWTAQFWFKVYNIGHQLTKSSMSLFMIKSSLLSQINFNEKLTMGEDIELMKTALKYGRFFYFSTKDVYTSTRRFEKIGWWKIFFSWIFVAILPSRIKQKFTYKVIR